MSYYISPQQAAQEILKRDEAAENLKAFIEFTTHKWEAGPIHEAICTQAERVVNGEIDRLLLLCPPQHGKSEIISRRLSAYILGKNPHKDIISASATATLAEGFGRDVRNCITSPEYQNVFPNMHLAGDSKAKGLWSTLQGGSYSPLVLVVSYSVVVEWASLMTRSDLGKKHSQNYSGIRSGTGTQAHCITA